MMKHLSLLRASLTVAVTAGVMTGGLAVAQASSSAPAGPSVKPVPVTVLGWGTAADGALGAGSGALSGFTPVKVKIPKGTTVISVRAGCDHSIALTATGSVLAWGDNKFGQVGDGTTKTPRNVPVRVKLPRGVKVATVRAGCEHSLALTNSGSVLSWGMGQFGALGDGGIKNQDVPVQVKLPKKVKAKAISAGCDDGFALTASGQIYAWGANGKGQLGDGTHKTRRNPVLVKLPAGAKATMISAGCMHAMAVTSVGLLAWGWNKQGQLGDGNTKSTDVPTVVPLLFRGTGPGTIKSIFAGCEHTIALFSKGAVLAWGSNADGQLGDGMPADSDKPADVMLPPGTTVKAISAGCDDGYALTTKGTVLAWGEGVTGELGNGGTSQSGVPVSVSIKPGLAVVVIGSGPAAQHTFAIAVPNAG